MANILIIGASGNIGNATRQRLLTTTEHHLTLMVRNPSRLRILDNQRETLMVGDVTDQEVLTQAIRKQDFVFVALSGDLPRYAQLIIETMDVVGVHRLAFITSMGIYNEIPAVIGENGNLEFNPILQPYRDAADLIEASDLDYTIIRPGWFDNGTDDYEITKKGEPFGGHDVSIKAIADLVTKLIEDPTLGQRESLGINRK